MQNTGAWYSLFPWWCCKQQKREGHPRILIWRKRISAQNKNTVRAFNDFLRSDFFLSRLSLPPCPQLFLHQAAGATLSEPRSKAAHQNNITTSTTKQQLLSKAIEYHAIDLFCFLNTFFNFDNQILTPFHIPSQYLNNAVKSTVRFARSGWRWWWYCYCVSFWTNEC